MADTYTLIEKITVGAAGATDVTFTSIPQTYTDLQIVISARSNRTSDFRDDHFIRFNGNTGTNYTTRNLNAISNSIGSGTDTSQTSLGRMTMPANAGTVTSNTFGSSSIYIPNYTSSNNKSVSTDNVMESNSTTYWALTMTAGLWSQTGAITSITIFPEVGSYMQYSTFYLYGIAKEGVNPSLPSAPYATGGDSILFDGTYWYHTFRTSGTFTPKKGLSCDILAVAGGGGGGHYRGGGGGAGGVIYWAGQSVSTASTVTIGAGGAGITSGSNSQFASLTVAVGGGAGSNSIGSNGGSGGGGGYDNGTRGTTTQTGTGATAFYGNNAGIITAGAASGGAGGGGAGAVGGNGITNSGGVGGNGINTYSSWHTATGTGVSGYIAGGGGGGGFSTVRAGGSGGGGAGGTNSALSVAGVANTGSGGGGGGDQGTAPEYNGSAGGSGLIIVRYAA